MAYVEGNWHTKIIAAHAEAWREETGFLRYLEIGVRYGPTFNAVLPYASEAVGVDIEDVSSHMHGGTFYHGSSDDFFNDYSGSKFNIIFIDGLHQYDQVRKDFVNAEQISYSNATIYLHDTWPSLRENESACGDVWKFAESLEQSGRTVFTFRTFPGLTAIQASGEARFPE